MYSTFSTHKTLLFTCIIILFSFGNHSITAQKSKEKGRKENQEKKKKIGDLIKTSKKLDGLFTIYQDTLTGGLQMLINKEQLDQEYIYFSQITDGVREASAFRGSYKSSKIFKIEKYFDKIDFVSQNTSSYFDPKNPLSKAADANISKGIMASISIEAADYKKGLFLIKMDDLFLKETFTQIKPSKAPDQKPKDFQIGTLDNNKTKIRTVKNYPENSNIVTEYVYSNPNVLNGGSRAITDARNVSIKVTHSLIKMPDNNYQTRFDDPRVGYFTTEVDDMTSTAAVPYRDLIHRWNLEKKNPNEALSEPVKPITWWIENTTPIQFRESVKEGVLKWNLAFEKAGIKNAIIVKIQPDDALWDAGDIRYNVLRWTSSPNPRFGGYGPSFVNPRTGEILGADIMLEYVFHTNRVKYDRLLNLSSSSEEETEAMSTSQHYCNYGYQMQENMLFGQAVLMTRGEDDLEMKGLKKEAMISLVMHEVGHTLGLNHNMKSSHLYSPEQLNNPDFIQNKAFIGSVMDYDLIHINKDKSKQHRYYSSELGPYDLWVIQCGYTPVISDSELEKIKSKSTLPELIFGNDADDMRAPGKGIDPRVMVNDMSNDPITYSIDRMELCKTMMTSIKSKFEIPGSSYQELLQAYFILKRQHANSGNVISRYIGGVYVDRAMIGQEGAGQPYTPVAYDDQKRAMEALKNYIFAPNAHQIPQKLYNYLAMQRRGFNFHSKPEDPKIHEEILSYQKKILDHLLHINTQQRIIDSELYGNTYSLSEMMTALNEAIFSADISSNTINTFRQNLQLTYTKMLINLVLSTKKAKNQTASYPEISKSIALYNLEVIQQMANTVSEEDIATKAHKAHLNILIKNAMMEIKS